MKARNDGLRQLGWPPERKPARGNIHPGNNVSDGGHIRHDARALFAKDRNRPDLPCLDQWPDAREGSEAHIEQARHDVVDTEIGPFVGHVEYVNTGRPVERLAKHMESGAHARTAIAQLSRAFSGEFNELAHGIGLKRRLDHDHDQRFDGPHDGCKTVRIERQVLDGMRQGDRRRSRGKQYRVAVRGRLEHGLRANGAARAGPVFREQGLPDRFADDGCQLAGKHVRANAGSERHNETNRFGGIGLRQRRQGAAEPGTKCQACCRCACFHWIFSRLKWSVRR